MIIIPFYLGHVLLLLVADLTHPDLLHLLGVPRFAAGEAHPHLVLLRLLGGVDSGVIENNRSLLLLDADPTGDGV